MEFEKDEIRIKTNILYWDVKTKYCGLLITGGKGHDLKYEETDGWRIVICSADWKK